MMSENEKMLSGDMSSATESVMSESLLGERQRYESMLGASSRMIASLSLVSVALATVMPKLLELFAAFERVLAMEFCTVFLLIVISLLFAVFAQYRRAYQGLDSPGDIYFKAKAYERDVFGPDKVEEWRVGQLDVVYKGLAELNNKMGSRLRVANILLVVDLILIALFGIVDVTVFLSAGC